MIILRGWNMQQYNLKEVMFLWQKLAVLAARPSVYKDTQGFRKWTVVMKYIIIIIIIIS
jgi:cytochrome c oxidase subunit IV